MSRQYFSDINAESPIAALTAVTATSETKLWDVATYTPIHAYEGKVGKMWELMACGIISFTSTSTLVVTPRIGTTTSGITLGVSPTQNGPGSTVTNSPFLLTGLLIQQTMGAAGNNSNYFFTGTLECNGTTSQAGWQVAFGGTVAVADWTIETGLFLGITWTNPGTITPSTIKWQSLN